MLLWRVSNHIDLSGEGGLRASARWHSAGRRIVYLGPNPASCLLEHMVHLEIDEEDVPSTFRTLKIEVPDAIFTAAGVPPVLPEGWRDNVELTQTIGNQWLADGPCLLRVPCALVPETDNVLLNPDHRDAQSVKVIAVIDFPFDQRLISVRS